MAKQSTNTTPQTTEEVKATNVNASPAPANKPARAKARKFDPTDVFPCRSVCYGELVLEGLKTKMLYTWANYGDYADVEFQDLQALQSRKSAFLTDPLFIIEDDELVEYWGDMLKPIYHKIEMESIEELLQLSPDRLKEQLVHLPKGVKESVKSMAASKFINGELDSINRIKAIDEALGTDLMIMVG